MEQATISATLLLRRAPYTALGPAGETCVDLLFAKDADGLFPHGLRARWVGPLAARFIQAHAGQLRPGRGLQVQLHHLHCARDELCARISNAQLAPLPPSWLNAQEHEPTHTD